MRRARNGSILELRSTVDVYFSRPAVPAAHVTYRQSFNQLLEGNFPLLPFQKKNEQQSQHKQIIDHLSSSEGLPEVDTASSGASDVTDSGCEGHGSPSLATSPLRTHVTLHRARDVSNIVPGAVSVLLPVPASSAAHLSRYHVTKGSPRKRAWRPRVQTARNYID